MTDKMKISQTFNLHASNLLKAKKTFLKLRFEIEINHILNFTIMDSIRGLRLSRNCFIFKTNVCKFLFYS